MVTVAIIDTGVDDHPWLDGALQGGVAIEQTEQGIAWGDDYTDLLGHGTAVAAVVHAFCPAAKLFAIRVARCEGRVIQPSVSEEMLAAAIEQALNREIKVINVSYSMESAEQDGVLAQVCRRALDAGVAVVASQPSLPVADCFPAAFPWVIGVGWRRKAQLGEIVVLDKERRNLETWGGPVRTAYLCDTTARLKGASFACAHVSAMIARMQSIDDRLNCDEALNYLCSSCG